jgi:hypothetical protein
VQLIHHIGGGAVEHVALFRQHEAAGVAMEQRDAQILLQA